MNPRYPRWPAVLVVSFFLLTPLLLATQVESSASSGGTADSARVCGMGGSNNQNRKLAACLSRQPGINVDRATALRIGNCESGFYRRAHNGDWHGIYQMTRQAFSAFSHQGPAWVDDEFRQYHYGIYSARGHILAAFAHAHRYGFDWIGVCG